MPAITWYMTNSLVSVHQEMSETSPGTDVVTSPVTGWIGGTGSTNRSKFDAQVERIETTFDSTTYPTGTIDTTIGDCWRSTNTYKGSFASASWEIDGYVAANTATGCAGRIQVRLLRGVNVNGSGATEITSAAQAGGIVTLSSSGNRQLSQAFFNPGAFNVSDEYIFVQIAWERTGAGAMSTSDINFWIGTGSSKTVSATFTPVMLPEIITEPFVPARSHE